MSTAAGAVSPPPRSISRSCARRRCSSASRSDQGARSRRSAPWTSWPRSRRLPARILRRITRLEHDLARLAQTRETQRKARERAGLPRVALVGYTNAGKSTLLNRLTHADVLVEDQLFSTLDPTVRRLRLPGGELVL